VRRIPALLIVLSIIISSLFIWFGLTTYFSPGSEPARIRLGTTTSTDNSGLLDYLHPIMSKEINIDVEVVAVGTGAALELGRRGLADVVMVHAPDLEDQFISEGYGFHRVDLMYNDFIIIGPSTDPANITRLANSTEIFMKLYESRDSITFVSRGDNSGTHIKENSLWLSAGIGILANNLSWAIDNPWYIETGSGMGHTLLVAGLSNAYTLTDRGTYLYYRQDLNLEILTENVTEWRNPYGVILVNPAAFDAGYIQFKTAKKYVQWLISNKSQTLIENYSIYGEPVFFADFLNHVNEMKQEELEFWGISFNENLKVFKEGIISCIKKSGRSYGS
jgi:tungstate transport system substrate-binding protein